MYKRQIPHTAIIPENKDRIADTMAAFLRDNFLTPAVVARRMSGMNLARGLGDFLASSERGGGGSRIAGGAGELFAEVLESLDPERLGDSVRSGLAGQIEKVEIAPVLGQVLQAAIADKRHLPLLDATIRWAGHALEANEPLVREMIHQRANALLRITGLDERLANSVLDGLYRLLAEVLVDPEHPVRGRIEQALESIAANLQHDPATRERVERAKNELLANQAVGVWWQGVWERLRVGLIDFVRQRGGNGAGGGVPGAFAGALADLGTALKRDPRLQVQINRFARRAAVGVATRHGGQIVQLVSETVRRWDARTVTDRIESAVGRDLQFIRINGTLVGGLVGMTIHFLDSVF